jgi:broad specificity phosphatase PhoE
MIDMKTMILLVRHAETVHNTEKRANGWRTNSPLTEKGKQQAGQLKKRLANEKIDLVYSSPVGRAYETGSTAKPDGLKITKDERLKERDFGEIDGQKWMSLLLKRPIMVYKYKKSGSFRRVKGAEEFGKAQDRFFNAVKDIAEKNKGKHILIFSHGTILRLFLAKVIGINQKKSMKMVIKNCSLNTLTYENGKFKVEKINEDGFLQ